MAERLDDLDEGTTRAWLLLVLEREPSDAEIDRYRRFPVVHRHLHGVRRRAAEDLIRAGKKPYRFRVEEHLQSEAFAVVEVRRAQERAARRAANQALLSPELGGVDIEELGHSAVSFLERRQSAGEPAATWAEMAVALDVGELSRPTRELLVRVLADEGFIWYGRQPRSLRVHRRYEERRRATSQA